MSADLHQRITATLLHQLDTADPCTWSPTWHGADPLPRNGLTGRRYRGLNILALWASAQEHGYADARWATYRQWAALGAQVRKGERGTLVLFYKDLPPGSRRTSDAGVGDPNEAAPYFVARAACVFNVAQVDGALDLSADAPASIAALTRIAAPAPALKALAAATGAVIVEGGVRACYVPATDTIHLPPLTAFHSSEGYAATLVHELVHWTGAQHRLARDLTGRFRARAYAAEELIAELGAAFILAELHLTRTPHADHAAYMASWLPLLRSDPRALATAATHASRAADYLTDLHLAGKTAGVGPTAFCLAEDESLAGSLVRPAASPVARPLRDAA